MGARPGGLNRIQASLALAAVLAASGGVAIAAAEHVRDVHHRHAVDRVRSGATSALEVRIALLADRAERYGDVLMAVPAGAAPARLTAVVRSDFPFAGVAGRRLPLHVASAGARGGSTVIEDAASAGVVSAAAASARDSAQPVAAVVSGRLVVVWPLYAGHPADTAGRRAASTGWVVGAIPLPVATQPLVDVSRNFGGGLAVRTAPAGPGEVSTVLHDAIALRVTRVPSESQLPAYLIGAVTLLGCIIVLGQGVRVRRRAEAAARTNAALSQRLALISGIGLTVQESLDMGHVLPAVLARMSEQLGLSYIAVVPGSAGGGVEMFALGRRPTAVPEQRWSLEMNSAEAGQLVQLPLQRVNRTLGYLEAVPVARLDDVAFASLRSTADLLAGALYNADLYEREQDSVRRLRDLDELKDDFLSTVSHELRTPLSVLVGFTSLLASDWDRIPEETRRESVTRMQRHIGSLTTLVNDLLDFMSERRMRSAECREVALDERVRDIVEGLRPLATGQDIVVSLEGPVAAWTDPRALDRILGNLVGNAMKYSPPGTTVRVTVADGHDATVTVADEGPGIRSEDQQRVFERFYRGDSEAARATRGTGIGLAVVLAWVRAVGARLDIASTEGSGTTITVHFPLSPEEPLDGAGTITWLDARVRSEELVQ